MKYNKTFKEALKQVREQDDKDHEISMARGELQAIADKALALNSALQGKSDEGNPLEAWVQSKITKAKDYINSVSDYLMYTPDMAKEDFDDINRQRGSQHMTGKVAALKTKLDKEKDTDALERQIVALQGQINLLKVALENEKNKTVKPEPNPDTGEVPLRTGLAQAILDKDTPSPDLKSLDKKKLKMSLGKTKIEVNPDVEIGVFSGGKQTTSGNLH
tara:strand:- start:289 stop:942 length:654 start_codon:yes stop_codon:yes gene_type:complete